MVTIKEWIYRKIVLAYHTVIIPVLVSRMRKEPIINVVFVIWDLERWKTEALFRAMNSHKRFKAVVMVPNSPYVDRDNKLSSLTHYLSNHHYEYYVLNGNQKIRDILKPHIIFYHTPYIEAIDKKLSFKRNLRSLFCYVHYAFFTNKIQDFTRDSLLAFAWQIYLDNPLVLSSVSAQLYTKGSNCLVTGTPYSDHLLSFPSQDHTDPWKQQDKRKCKIIWAPHHSIPSGFSWIHTSTFFRYYEFILSIADKYKDFIQIAFKPHPFLKSRLYDIWGKEKTDSYYSAWDKVSNTQLYMGDNLSLFYSSDALIHDCGSFTIEYLHTKKPVMYLLNDSPQDNNWNEFGKMAFNLHYKGYCEVDIEQFIINVIDGRDEMKPQREQFLKTHLLPPGRKSASEIIIDAILGDHSCE